MTATIYELDPSIITPDDMFANHELLEAANSAYESSASGPLTAVPSSVAYLPLSTIMSTSQIASLASQSVLGDTSDLRNKILSRQLDPIASTRLGHIEYNLDVRNYSPFFAPESGKKYATMLQMLQYPFSKGSIHIGPPEKDKKATTAADKPIIDPQYYGGPGGKIDFDIMVAAQKFGDKIMRTAPLSSIISSRVFPPEKASEDEDEDFTNFVRNCTQTDWHPVGTCSMGGAEGISGGVVNARLRVYGVRGLRVVDASVMPLQISAHLQATVYAIAEKGADLVLEDRLNSS